MPPAWPEPVGFRGGAVTVRVPATSANLGPGFDSLGLALARYDELTAEVTDAGLSVSVEGEGAADVPRDERHLVVAAMHAAFDLAGARPPGLALTCRNRLPHGRGLGSSSAAIVGGLVLARGLLADPGALGDDVLLDVATRIEGHPDNVAPALLGGFVVCGTDEGGTFAVPGVVAAGVSAVVLVPPYQLATEAARVLLPASVPHAAAARNAGRAALLVAALGHRPDQLLRATEDLLHQEQRAPAMPETLELVRALRADGVPAVVSGAGPTVLGFVGGPVGVAPDAVRARCPQGWSAHHLDIAGPGAAVVAPDGC